jgi:CRP/FNR family transcriptional regulator, cyclic AMP receptor protein
MQLAGVDGNSLTSAGLVQDPAEKLRSSATLADATIEETVVRSSALGARRTCASDVVGPDKRTLKDACYLLLNCSLFGGLRPDERAEVVALARVRTFNAGETVFAIGSPGDQMMALLSGTIRISVPSSGGKELLLAVIQPGEVFGELAVLDGKERSADAVAETACTVAILDRREFLSFFERNPSAWPSLVKVLCQRLRHTNQVFAEVALLELPVRLAKAMLRVLNWEADSAAAEPAKIRFSQRELANMLGGSRESVNKCLRNWQRTGVVRISGGSIIISDRRALENIAEPA